MASLPVRKEDGNWESEARSEVEKALIFADHL